MNLPITEREQLIAAALRVIRADHYQRDDDPNGDAEAEYAEDLFAAAARTFVAALDQHTTNPATRDEAAPRAAFINALPELAAFLAAHPDVPVPSHQIIVEFIHGETDTDQRAQVDAAAKAMGVTAGGDTHYQAALKFGPVTYEVLAIAKQELADHDERMRLGREAFDAQRVNTASTRAAT